MSSLLTTCVTQWSSHPHPGLLPSVGPHGQRGDGSALHASRLRCAAHRPRAVPLLLEACVLEALGEQPLVDVRARRAVDDDARSVDAGHLRGSGVGASGWRRGSIGGWRRVVRASCHTVIIALPNTGMLEQPHIQQGM
eukprot:6556689-Prymnesium_polylepis.1